MQLICVFVFCIRKKTNRLFHDVAHKKRFECNKYQTVGLNEPRCEKTDLPGFRPGSTQTGLYYHTRWLEA